jgi:hypothetical protein
MRLALFLGAAVAVAALSIACERLDSRNPLTPSATSGPAASSSSPAAMVIQAFPPPMSGPFNPPGPPFVPPGPPFTPPGPPFPPPMTGPR